MFGRRPAGRAGAERKICAGDGADHQAAIHEAAQQADDSFEEYRRWNLHPWVKSVYRQTCKTFWPK